MTSPTTIAENEELDLVGGYLTDECKLFRVVGRHTLDGQRLIEIEDCLTLDVWLVSIAELQPLRLIRTTDDDAET